MQAAWQSWTDGTWDPWNIKSLPCAMMWSQKLPRLTCLTSFTCTSHPVQCVPLLTPALLGRNGFKGNALFRCPASYVNLWRQNGSQNGLQVFFKRGDYNDALMELGNKKIIKRRSLYLEPEPHSVMKAGMAWDFLFFFNIFF